MLVQTLSISLLTLEVPEEEFASFRAKPMRQGRWNVLPCQDSPNAAGIKADMVPPQKWTAEWECQPSKDKKEANFFKTADCGLQSFVTMKGGEYFFAPCLSFLKNLP